ncbi:M20 family metallopeptidase [Sedimentibacter sp.]|uniref:M20 metallopeptidase family protein n=1 Tax=Sedimentibacter sp. TaxID=1960295 RepID=UPI0028AD9C76|nr:M20 family metallopeptidase [Sedimentibacter sp.]
MYIIDNAELINIRREFHQNPELGGNEHKTMERICRYLDSWNIEYEKGVAETGVIAIIRGKNKKPDSKCIAVRADIDALPIKEEAEFDYKSLNDGIMHACGHDAHTAIALMTAKITKSLEDKINGDVKFFFQPAEETTGGAERMIKHGCLKNPDVEFVFGLHVDTSLKTGTIGIKYGKMMAASDEININIKGKSCHGAQPHNGEDPIVASSSIVLSLQSVISRNVSPLNSAVITIGSIHGGTQSNIIPDDVYLNGIMRTLDPETRNFIKKRVSEVVENVSEACGAEGTVSFRESYGPLINNDQAVDLLKETAVNVLGNDNVKILEFPDMGTEDFSYFCLHSKGCFFNLGCRNTDTKEVYPLHSSKFVLDETCLQIGVKIQVENILNILR